MTYGQVPYPVGGGALGREVSIIASMTPSPGYKTGGFTIDWNSVIPVVVNTTIAGAGKVVKAGDSYLRYGQMLCKVTATTNGRTVGKFVPYSAAMTATTVASGGTVLGVSTLTMTAVTNMNVGDYLTVDTAGQQEVLQIKSIAGSVVTFVTPTTKTHANAVAVTKVDDGNQTLRRGECFLLIHSVYLQGDIFSVEGHGVLNSGSVYLARVAGDVSGGVVGNPTRAQIETAMPDLHWVLD